MVATVSLAAEVRSFKVTKNYHITLSMSRILLINNINEHRAFHYRMALYFYEKKPEKPFGRYGF